MRLLMQIQCDEGQPTCSACARHGVECEYVQPAPRRPPGGSSEPQYSGSMQASLPAEATSTHSVTPTSELCVPIDHALELRLMHEWTAWTCVSFSPSKEFWRHGAVMVGVEYRCVLDAMFALSALHVSRQMPYDWDPGTRSTDHLDTRAGPISEPGRRECGTAGTSDVNGSTTNLREERKRTMRCTARLYFDRAMSGYRKELASLTATNVEAANITSVLASHYVFFTLGEETTLGPTGLPSRLLLWMQLGSEIRSIYEKWVQDNADAASHLYFGSPDLDVEEDLYQTELGNPFSQLLTFASEYETITTEDKIAYVKALSYIAYTFNAGRIESESPLELCRRLVAMPSRLPARLTELVCSRAPRALVMLAHVMALIQFINKKVSWLEGIAECQIPALYQLVPKGWDERMSWPLMAAESGYTPFENQAVRY